MELKMWLAFCVVDGDVAVAVVVLAAHKRDDSRRGLTPMLYTEVGVWYWCRWKAEPEPRSRKKTKFYLIRGCGQI